ncbi:MAG TPA: SDR family NAD(P)-dependent oxidoreductase [Nitrospiria bacterium]|nr:SDR family NAD(P)-dependent oxidoreductase [Nitrospiria bacterium]
MSHLKDQVAIVTGGSSGIGLAISRAFVREGMRVTIAARDKRRLNQAALQLKSRSAGNDTVLAVQTDVSRATEVRQMVRQTLDRFGRLDVLVNNAGIGRLAPLDRLKEKEWDETLGINLKGVFLCTQAVLPGMKRRRGGYVVNISSVAGKEGFAGGGAYCASKFGVMALTETLIEEAKSYDIRATAICPGYVDTPMVAGVPVPAAEMIRPEDIAQTVLYLLHLSKNVIVREIVMTRTGTE